MELPVIDIRETEALQIAMEQDSPFYLVNRNKKKLVYDAGMKKAADEIITALERAEACTEYVTEEQFFSRAKQ